MHCTFDSECMEIACSLMTCDDKRTHFMLGLIIICDDNRIPVYVMLGLTESDLCRFKDATKQVFEYNEQGESNRGYHIYTIKQSQGGSSDYYYDNVSRLNEFSQVLQRRMGHCYWRYEKVSNHCYWRYEKVSNHCYWRYEKVSNHCYWRYEKVSNHCYWRYEKVSNHCYWRYEKVSNHCYWRYEKVSNHCYWRYEKVSNHCYWRYEKVSNHCY